MPLLEVIALDAADARVAERGGASRLEIVADMAADGLTPDPAVLADIRQATTLPLRVMLRAREGFLTDPAELDRLRTAAEILAKAGADGFVFGFLNPAGGIDAAATTRLAESVAPLPWTFHRAIDHSEDPVAAWPVVAGLPGLDTVLTAGSPNGVGEGLELLIARAALAASARLVMAGGGLRPEHVPVLAEAGVAAFHVGSAVRTGGSWDGGVEADLVARWRELVG